MCGAAFSSLGSKLPCGGCSALYCRSGWADADMDDGSQPRADMARDVGDGQSRPSGKVYPVAAVRNLVAVATDAKDYSLL